MSVEGPEKLSEKELLTREQLEALVRHEMELRIPTDDRFKSSEEMADSLEDIEVVRQGPASLNELPVPFMKLEAARRERVAREGGGASVRPADGLAESDP